MSRLLSLDVELTDSYSYTLGGIFIVAVCKEQDGINLSPNICRIVTVNDHTGWAPVWMVITVAYI